MRTSPLLCTLAWILTQVTNWLDGARATGRRTSGRDEIGASLVEYALLVALIAVVCITAVTFFGGALNNNYSQFGSAVNAAGR